jgi:UDP-N-acetylmuramate dehydrogenase
VTTTTPENLKENVPFGSRTTLGVGGRARWGAQVQNIEELQAVLQWARDQSIAWRVLGEGSNTLVSDDGYDGLLIEWSPDSFGFEERGDFVECDADAGLNWDRLVEAAVAREAAGIECLSGIPGTIGAAPIQNIGAYGQELSDVAVAVRVWDCLLGRETTIPARACAFRYRSSRFKTEDAGRFIVLSLKLRLRAGGAPTLKYQDLRDEFVAAGRTPSLGEVRNRVLSIRASKSMVLDDADSESRSAGSFFVNPVVGQSEAQRIAAIAIKNGVGTEVPMYEMGAGRAKIPAAWLIERAGIEKGFALGAAHISQKHTLAIVADEGAKAEDVVDLARHVRATVRDFWGVELTPEPGFVGFRQSVSELLEQRA